MSDFIFTLVLHWSCVRLGACAVWCATGQGAAIEGAPAADASRSGRANNTSGVRCVRSNDKLFCVNGISRQLGGWVLGAASGVAGQIAGDARLSLSSKRCLAQCAVQLDADALFAQYMPKTEKCKTERCSSTKFCRAYWCSSIRAVDTAAATNQPTR